MPTDERIGDRIKAIRIAKGMDQKQLADMVGISKSSISEWENCKRAPRMSTLRKIAAALGVDVWDIIGYDDSVEFDGASSELSKEEQDLIDVYRAMDDYGRKVVRTVADLEFERWRDELYKEDQRQEGNNP